MAGEQRPWVRVDVDEDGVMVVRDLVEDTASEPIDTVGQTPRQWADAVRDALLALLDQAGCDIS
ncbi:MAG TPA: hypothetical protein VFT75_18580 [Nocardioidaceae bacterium]|nr:hypothetical protein [Nocardioidaceae bacterium]